MLYDIQFDHLISPVMPHDVQSVSQSSSLSARYPNFFLTTYQIALNLLRDSISTIRHHNPAFFTGFEIFSLPDPVV